MMENLFAYIFFWQFILYIIILYMYYIIIVHIILGFFILCNVMHFYIFLYNI
jgi:hypothetical protein